MRPQHSYFVFDEQKGNVAQNVWKGDEEDREGEQEPLEDLFKDCWLLACHYRESVEWPLDCTNF